MGPGALKRSTLQSRCQAGESPATVIEQGLPRLCKGPNGPVEGLKRRLSGSRSMERLGEAVSEVIASESYRRLVRDGLAPAVWAAGYAERLAAGDA